MTSSGFFCEPIGIVRSPFDERLAAPRQAVLARGVGGRIELFAGRGYEDALSGLEQWDYAWVLFVFHRNVEQGRGWKPKVQPPRSDIKRGVFATRSPHRPNPIGLSAVKIDRVDGLVVHVSNLDVLDGSPVLDIKPYVPYADAYPDARSGWLEPRDPLGKWQVAFDERAREQLAWLKDAGVDLEGTIEAALAAGPLPHAYRRIRKRGDAMCLALKEWRVDFSVCESVLRVHELRTGYRPRELTHGGGASELHRVFFARFAQK